MPMNQQVDFDAVVVGAGFSGLYMLHLLREAGYSAQLYEAAGDVGGTWYWNQYPGARCDVPAEFYSYTFSEEIHRDWKWSAVYPEQDEILSYIKYVTDKLDLRKDIQFNTRITDAKYDPEAHTWTVNVGGGRTVTSKYFIPAIGNVSVPHAPAIPGLDKFRGQTYHTSQWPHEPVDFKGKRVAVIGTGSSGVQAITAISKEAEHLTVFQRTPQYVMPVENPKVGEDDLERRRAEFPTLRKRVREHIVGMPCFDVRKPYSALEDTEDERNRHYEALWQEAKGFQMLYAYTDLTINDEANATIAEFVRGKIREIVKDPVKTENLMPTYLLGGKRPVVATNYYESYNRENVDLVNLKKTPIVECTENGLVTADGTEHELDIIVFASGFDAMIGPLAGTKIRGREGITLKEKWDDGRNLKTYLGVCHVGFPNMFTITGPHFPLTANALAVNEVIAEWVIDCIEHAEKQGLAEVEATPEGEEDWTAHVNEVGEQSIYARTDSWYTGANIEGKPRAFYGYTGDFQTYQDRFEKSKDYKALAVKPLQQVETT